MTKLNACVLCFQVVFGGLIALKSGTGLNIFAGVDEQLVALGLNRLKFLVSAASDGAGAMLGPAVGFQSRLLRSSPICLGWHCVGHSQVPFDMLWFWECYALKT